MEGNKREKKWDKYNSIINKIYLKKNFGSTSLHTKPCPSFPAHRGLKYHFKLDSVMCTLGVRESAPWGVGCTGGVKNKFNDCPGLPHTDTGLRCPAVQPLVLDPVPPAGLSHSQSGCHTAAQMGRWLGLMGEQVALPAGAKNAPTERYLCFTSDNLPYGIHCSKVGSVCSLFFGGSLSSLD